MHKESDNSPFWSCFLTCCWVSEQMSLRCRCVILRNLTGLQASPNSSMKGTRTQQNTVSARIRQKDSHTAFIRMLFLLLSVLQRFFIIWTDEIHLYSLVLNVSTTEIPVSSLFLLLCGFFFTFFPFQVFKLIIAH